MWFKIWVYLSACLLWGCMQHGWSHLSSRANKPERGNEMDFDWGGERRRREKGEVDFNHDIDCSLYPPPLPFSGTLCTLTPLQGDPQIQSIYGKYFWIPYLKIHPVAILIPLPFLWCLNKWSPPLPLISYSLSSPISSLHFALCSASSTKLL